jgi:hypothetical protein
MLWNEVDADLQKKVIAKVEAMLDKTSDRKTYNAILAAMYELQLWSNVPCETHEQIESAQAQDPYDII